jgi:hypothetical protein
MESFHWRAMNYGIAMINLLKSKTYFTIRSLRRRISIPCSTNNNPS